MTFLVEGFEDGAGSVRLLVTPPPNTACYFQGDGNEVEPASLQAVKTWRRVFADLPDDTVVTCQKVQAWASDNSSYCHIFRISGCQVTGP